MRPADGVRRRASRRLDIPCLGSGGRSPGAAGVRNVGLRVERHHAVAAPSPNPRDAPGLVPSSATDAVRHRPNNGGAWRGPHHTRSSHLLHQLGNWSTRAAAGVTVSCLLGVWAVIGVVTGFPSWWQVALYSTTSAVTVVMVFAIQHTQRREQLVT